MEPLVDPDTARCQVCLPPVALYNTPPVFFVSSVVCGVDRQLSVCRYTGTSPLAIITASAAAVLGRRSRHVVFYGFPGCNYVAVAGGDGGCHLPTTARLSYLYPRQVAAVTVVCEGQLAIKNWE